MADQALDGITNPQNLGMIIRPAAAGAIDGILLPRKGTAALGPLVIKASAGTLYRAPLLLCASLPEALKRCQEHGAQVCVRWRRRRHTLCLVTGTKLRRDALGNEPKA